MEVREASRRGLKGWFMEISALNKEVLELEAGLPLEPMF